MFISSVKRTIKFFWGCVTCGSFDFLYVGFCQCAYVVEVGYFSVAYESYRGSFATHPCGSAGAVEIDKCFHGYVVVYYVSDSQQVQASCSNIRCDKELQVSLSQEVNY